MFIVTTEMGTRDECSTINEAIEEAKRRRYLGADDSS